jgi:hypothetical protein
VTLDTLENFYFELRLVLVMVGFVLISRSLLVNIVFAIPTNDCVKRWSFHYYIVRGVLFIVGLFFWIVSIQLYLELRSEGFLSWWLYEINISNCFYSSYPGSESPRIRFYSERLVKNTILSEEYIFHYDGIGALDEIHVVEDFIHHPSKSKYDLIISSLSSMDVNAVDEEGQRDNIGTVIRSFNKNLNIVINNEVIDLNDESSTIVDVAGVLEEIQKDAEIVNEMARVQKSMYIRPRHAHWYEFRKIY